MRLSLKTLASSQAFAIVELCRDGGQEEPLVLLQVDCLHRAKDLMLLLPIALKEVHGFNNVK